MKPIKNLNFEQKNYPEVLSIVNRLANLEQRRPHDIAKRILLQVGRERLANFDKSHPQPALAGES